MTLAASRARSGESAIAVGIGESDYHRIMRMARWTVADCPEEYGVTLCTQNDGISVSEPGDSGGPLLIQRDAEWRQAGIAIWVDQPQGITGFASVADHAQWIRSVSEVETPPVSGLPSPPPAPPPFRPQPIDVPLGNSGDTLTLMTTEDGGFTFDGQPFSGGVVTTENGNTYMVALESGAWSAEPQTSSSAPACVSEPPPVVILEWADGKWAVRIEEQP